MRHKLYSMWAKAVDSNGETHYVTVVGEYDQRREYVTKPTQTDLGLVMMPTKMKTRNFKMAYSICAPEDEFDEGVGIAIAKSRLKRRPIGSLQSTDVTMLNADACEMLVFCELNHIVKNIDLYMQRNGK